MCGNIYCEGFRFSLNVSNIGKTGFGLSTQIWTSKLTHNSSRGERNWTKNYKRNHPNIVILDSSNLLHLQEPKMRGQACWSMGKLFSIIGHLAFTVNLQKNFNSTTSHQIPDNTSSSKWYLHSLIFGEVY